MIVPGQKINPHRLLKREMLWLMTHYCRHHHTYASHPNCYFEEKPSDGLITEKVGLLDIESTGLKGNWDYVLSYCIKELDGPIYERMITPAEIRGGKFDVELLKKCCKDMRQFDRIVVHFGSDRKHDLPFLRSRCLYWQMKHGIDLDFPLYKEVYVSDTYLMAKAKLSLHSYRLESICQHLGIPAKGHRLEPELWQKAQIGDKESLQWILEHNREDVISLEGVWKALIPYYRNSKISI